MCISWFLYEIGPLIVPLIKGKEDAGRLNEFSLHGHHSSGTEMQDTCSVISHVLCIIQRK